MQSFSFFRDKSGKLGSRNITNGVFFHRPRKCRKTSDKFYNICYTLTISANSLKHIFPALMPPLIVCRHADGLQSIFCRSFSIFLPLLCLFISDERIKCSSYEVFFPVASLPSGCFLNLHIGSVMRIDVQARRYRRAD